MDIDAARLSAGELRNRMVDRLLGWGSVQSPRVEAAMRAVPRHVFVPDAAVEAAYADDGVVTHPGPDGRPRSMASAPSVVAKMLEQLDVHEGHRVLEIGAGSGYNAALLAYLAGPGGEVTTVDIDDDVVWAARRGLAAAGFHGVRVVVGDGEYGHPGRAPYDRLVVTAGAWDVPPAWTDQLAADGRIVVPLRVCGLTRSVALERENRVLRSRSMGYCGFIPLRGAGLVPEPTVRLGDGEVSLRFDDRQSADPGVEAGVLGRALDHPAEHTWLGVACTARELEQVEFWLAAMDGFCRLLARSDPAGHDAGSDAHRGLVKPMYGWGSMAVVDRDTFAYLTMRETGRTGDRQQTGGRKTGGHKTGGERTFELGVCAYGPHGRELADRVAEQIRRWDRDGRSLTDIWIEVHPAGTASTVDGQLVADKRHTRVIVRTGQGGLDARQL